MFLFWSKMERADMSMISGCLMYTVHERPGSELYKIIGVEATDDG